MLTLFRHLLIVILAIGTGTLSSQINLQNSLQACYPLDCPAGTVIVNSATTSSALDGTLVGNVTCTTGHNGAPGTALHFGGTVNDFVLLPSSPLIKPTSSLTISGWFYFDANSHSDIIFTRNTCASFFNMNNLIWNSGQFWLVKRPGMPGGCGSGVTLATPVNVVYPINTWHHVIAYADDSTLEIIVNNGTPATLSHSVLFDYAGGKEVVLGGTNETAANNPFKGRIDELRFYDRKLTAAEITALYNGAACVEVPVAEFSFDKSTVCVGEQVHITENSSSNPVTFSWQMSGANPSTSTLTAPVITYSAPGIYTVSLIAGNGGGNSAPFSQTIQVSACTSIDGSSGAADILVFPNPASSVLYLTGPANSQARLTGISGSGLQVLFRETSPGKFEADLLNLSPGLYFLEISRDMASPTRIKIIISR